MAWIARHLRTRSGLVAAGALVALLCAIWIAVWTQQSQAAFASTNSGAMAHAARAPSPTSDAKQFPITGIDVQDAVQVAIGFWGWAPCGGNVTIQWGKLSPTINAVSTWWNPVAAYGNAQANSDCDVTLNTAQAYTWPMLCTVITHEYGHLTGHQHVPDPSNVMYPVYVQPISQCQTPDPSGAPAQQPGSGAGGSGSPQKKSSSGHGAAGSGSSHRARSSGSRGKH